MTRTKRFLFITLACLAFVCPTRAQAVGTPAGTVVDNQAQVSLFTDGNTINITSNQATFSVEEIVDLTLTWQDASNVFVEPGGTAQTLTFLLTNTGNGTERFLLDVDNSALTDQFDPLNSQIFLDSDGNGSYQAGVDQAYHSSTNTPTLTADEGVVIFVLNDIPNVLNDTDTGISTLKAEAATGTGSPGDVFPQPPGGVTSVLGTSGGQASAEGIYENALPQVTLDKSYQVTEPDGGSDPVTGATITYSLLAAIPSTEAANNLVVSDVIPPGTTYVPNSMRLIEGANTTILTDASDLDEGVYLENPPSSGNFEVQFSLGNLTNTTRTVTFQVIID